VDILLWNSFLNSGRSFYFRPKKNSGSLTNFSFFDQTGEADLKFAGWARRLGVPMAADAIDGDFVPIGLLNAGRQIAICRLMVGGEVGVRATEWIDVDLLRTGMSIAMVQMAVPPIVPWRDWQLHCLVALIALTGTDFSRNLPLLKPKRLWTMLPTVLPVLLRCFRLSEPEDHWLLPEESLIVPSDEFGQIMQCRYPQIDVKHAVDLLVSAIYKGLFPCHTGEIVSSFEPTMAKLRSSRLADRTKQLLPSEARATCTMRNVNFLLLYWTAANPNSMAQGFGFREGADGRVEWDE
jgi:hypothetical protein